MSADMSVDHIDASLAAGQPTARGYDKCPWCFHGWHGLGCSTEACRCETAGGALDDTWRPRAAWLRPDRILKLMAETGCDGYAAAEMVPPMMMGSDYEMLARAQRQMRQMYGESNL